MTTPLSSRSSWIKAILYKSCPDGSRYIAVMPRIEPGEAPVALLYGPDIPEWLPGLLVAGTGRRSPGRAFNLLLKGKYPYQRVEGAEKVRELKEMMK